MDFFRKKSILKSSQDEQFAHSLTAFDLLFLGIGAIIGAGIFVLTGIAAATQAGPGIMLSYVLAGLACAFAALSYAELAALIGGCGSAYGYSYAGFGEIIAWIVGWDLLLEYGISVSAVSTGWSGYFHDLLRTLHLEIPSALLYPPAEGGLFNVLSSGIIIVLSILLIYGVKLSATINNIMVIIKLSVIAIFLITVFGDFNLHYWSPYLPFGWTGVINGASLIFFAYIGFDAVSTTAEEAINPQRDLPFGIVGSLIICTVLYILVAGLLTGIVPYNTLNVSSPISEALLKLGHHFAAGLIGVGAVVGLTTVMLALFYGLTRICFAMSRDGLLPQYLSALHPEKRTPIRIICLWGFVMAMIAGLFPLHELASLVNIGTLFAFTIVCIGVIVLRKTHPELPRPFKTPFMPVIPLLGIFNCIYLMIHLPLLTWIRFISWMFLGLIVYFTYSQYTSQLNKKCIDEKKY